MSISERSAPFAISWLALTALVAGCAPDSIETSLEIGTGEAAFEPLLEGQEVPLIRGAQGGYHVWLSLRAEGLASERGDLRLEVWTDDDSMPPQESWVRVWLQPAESGVQLVGWPAIVAHPECFAGKLVHIRAVLTDAEDRVAIAETTLVPTGTEMGVCE